MTQTLDSHSSVGQAHTPRSRSRVALRVLGWLVWAPLAAFVVARVVALDAVWPLALAGAFTVWALVPAWPLAALAAWRREWSLAVASLALVFVHALWLVPNLVAASLPPEAVEAPRLRVVSANLLGTNTQIDALADELAATGADLLFVCELRAAGVDALDRALGARLPYRHLAPRADYLGVGLYSSAPLDSVEVSSDSGTPTLRARLFGAGRPLTFYGIHTLPPIDPGLWRRTAQQLDRLGAQAQAEPGDVILAGDFNTTAWSRDYAGLLARGFRGAHEARGRGLAVTWPNGRGPVPPVRIDHVLVSRGIDVIDVSEGVGAGSDHKPVIADLALTAQR